MAKQRQAKVVKVAGPVVVAEGMTGARMYDVVRVGELNLIGEIVELKGDLASIQVYEETTGMGPGEPVVNTEYTTVFKGRWTHWSMPRASL
jgi:V/A-type H+-transporting ATPase subunit A